MAGVEYESVLCVKPTVFVFRIPPRSSNRGYRAADWKLDQPDWTGRMRVVAKGKELSIKLEDKNSGELFAKCPVEQYPSITVEPVTDSSRYFVLRIVDDSGRSAFIGIGFEDRGDSFDLNVALQDHFKHLQQEKEAEKVVQDLQKGPKLDLGFKEGQTIRINISQKKNTKDNGCTKKSKSKGPTAGSGALPPPPGCVKLPAPTWAATTLGSFPSHDSPTHKQQNVSNVSVNSHKTNPSNVDLLLDLGFESSNGKQTSFISQEQSSVMRSFGQGQNSISQPNGQSQRSLLDFDSDFELLQGTSQQSSGGAKPANGSVDPWGDFMSASNNMASSDQSWENF